MGTTGNKLWSATLLLMALTDIVMGQNMKTLRTLAEWKDLEYDFETDANRKLAIDSGLYVPGQGIPIDVDVDYKGNINNKRYLNVEEHIR